MHAIIGGSYSRNPETEILFIKKANQIGSIQKTKDLTANFPTEFAYLQTALGAGFLTDPTSSQTEMLPAWQVEQATNSLNEL